MESYETDFNLAYELQMEEVMTDSLLQLQIGEKDPESIELLLKFEQERKDGEKWRIEMRKVQDDLKLRVHDQKFALEILQIPEEDWLKQGENVQKPFNVLVPFGEGTSSSASTSAVVMIDDGEGEGEGEAPFKLYFKGLFSNVGENSIAAAIGAAVCDPCGNLLLNIQKPLIIGDWKAETLNLKVEVLALMEGLNAALSLDIKNISFFCDSYPLFQYITMRGLPKEQEIQTILDQLLLLQQKYDSCRPFFVARKDVQFAFKLARDAMDSQSAKSAESSAAGKEGCSICFEDVDVGQIFSIDGCLHRYCILCMKQHVEAKLLNGMLPRCPHEGCITMLDIQICRKFLPPELLDLMNKHMKESSISATEKIYCPYPNCSALMSKTNIPYTNDVFIDNDQSRRCTKCDGLFCINCKVPWHVNISCEEYKKLNPDPNDAKLKSLAIAKSWRQCTKCNIFVELIDGCYHMTCRCGNEFCYTCGAEWRGKTQTCNCPLFDEHNDELMMMNELLGQRL